MSALTLRQAFDAGHQVIAYCCGPQCSGRFVTADKVPARLLDHPVAELAQARAFRCSRHPDAAAVVHVNREHVGVTMRVAEFQQPAA